MTTEELIVEIADIETYRAMFCYCGLLPKTGQKFEFEISFRKNDLDGLVKHLMSFKRDFIVTFNGVSFDGQVLQFILDNHQKWFDLTPLQVVRKIQMFALELIDNQNYELPPPYKEHYLDFKQIDLFKILHYDNENRRTGLKWAFEFSLDGDIEELPIDPNKEFLTSEEIDQVLGYCWNDVYATYNGYKICLGDTEHPDYKGKNKVQLRLDLIEEYKLSHTAINWNDVKIGAELNKKNYMELAKITQNGLWDKIKKRKLRTVFDFKDCFPEYIKFETKEFKEFFKRIGNSRVDIWKKQEFPFTYKGTTYMFAKGGGHSNDKPRRIVPRPDQILMDADVGSMYPNIIRKRRLYPVHLGPLWNDAYVGNIPKRLEAKAMFKKTKEPKYENIADVFKLVLNGNFGRLIDRHDWQYDPFAGFSVTIGGECDIFMLAEDFAMAGFQVVSMNTDGLTVLLDRSRLDEYYRICRAWEKEVGNDTLGNLEYVEYSLLAQTSVNDYIAIKHADWKEIDGKFQAVVIDKPITHKDKVKKKGDFLTYYELHKNKSKCIVPIALEKYFTQDIPVDETIRKHENIFDFCIAKKASRDYFYRSMDRKTGKATDLNKLVRYYCAISSDKKLKELKEVKTAEEKIEAVKAAGWTQFADEWLIEEWDDDGGCEMISADLEEAYQKSIPAELVPGKLYKIKQEYSDKRGPAISNCEADSKQQILFNRPFKATFDEYGVDYSYYERACNKILDKISPEYKRDRIQREKGQLSLF